MKRAWIWHVGVLAFALAPACARAQVPGELRGRVTTTIGGTETPVAHARVEIVSRPEYTWTDVDGVFSIRGLEPGDYTVRVRVVGYRVRDRDVSIENGRTSELNVVLDAATVLLDTVVTRAARDTQRPGVTTFDRAAIESSGRRDVGELLESTPGVVITQAGGPGSETHASIRGSSASEVLVLLDGVPLNSPITGEADLSRISLENVERVVIHKGSESARFGPGALGGTIEIQTRRADGDVSLALRTGAWGERDAALTLSGVRQTSAGALGGSISGDYRTLRGDFPYDVPDVRGGGIAHRVNSASTSRQILGSATWEHGLWTLSAHTSAEDLDRGLAGSIVQASTTGREGQRRIDGGVDASYHRDAFAWNFTTALTGERATYIDPTPPFGEAYNDTVHATGLTMSTRAVLGGDAQSASLGGELRTTDVSSTMLAPGAPHRQRLLGAFAGLHAARDVRPLGVRASIDLDARVDQSSLSGSAVSPRARAAVSRDHVTVSVSIGDGYSPPSLADQFFHEGVLVRPNPSLGPERTRNDIELRVAATDVDAGFVRLDAEGALYRANIDGMVLWFPDFRFIWSPSNFDVKRSGSEWSARATLKAIPLDVHGTLNVSTVDYTGPVLSGQVVYRPRVTGDVSIGAGSPSLRVEATNQYVGARRTVSSSALNSLDPYWRTDAQVSSSRPWGAYELVGTLAVDNLFDQPAAMLVDYPFPGRSWSVSLRVRRGTGSVTH